MFNFQKKVSWTPELGRKAEWNSIFSTCCTAMGDVPFDNAAIIILFMKLQGAGDGTTMFSTCMFYLIAGCFTIPASWFASRFKTPQHAILSISLLCIASFTTIILSPLFAPYSIAVLLIALFIFGLGNSVYFAAWFPLLSTFLNPETRGNYFGKMRFFWQTASALLLLGISCQVGQHASIKQLQMVMLLGIAIFSMRMFFIAKIPEFLPRPGIPKTTVNFKPGFMATLKNKALLGFALYNFFLNLAVYCTIPLTVLYLKEGLRAPDKITMFTSSIVLCGMLFGSITAGKLLKILTVKWSVIISHAVYVFTCFSIFSLSKNLLSGVWLYVAIDVIIFIFAFNYALSSVTFSTEMMHLCTDKYRSVEMALCNSCYYIGSGLSRLLCSLILGSGALAGIWFAGKHIVTCYQTVFLVMGTLVLLISGLLILVPAVFPQGNYNYDKNK